MKGVLLINLGTPDAPDVPAVRRYLAEFLSDPRVLDMHPAARWLLLHGVILRTRPARSAHAYGKIWTPQGSPLLLHSEALARALQARLGQGYKVALGMRYGNPSLGLALAGLQQAGCDEIVAIPLYPQYSSAATASATDALFAAASALPAVPSLRLISEFHADPGFIDAVATVAREQLDGFSPDHVLLSYHGVPEHQVRKSEIGPPGGARRCLASADCCAALGPHNRQCYRAQCFATSRLLAGALGLSEDGWSVAFQSRLGRVPWIRPYTDEVLQALAARGVKRLAVLTPSFTADCLETLEEIAMTGRDTFLAAGGQDFRMVPCVNAHPRWVQAVAAMVQGAAA
ncbi:ferrochelatase [Myxococcota bacterium]|nr:ferrochelatase [Myxococcota bacterium]